MNSTKTLRTPTSLALHLPSSSDQVSSYDQPNSNKASKSTSKDPASASKMSRQQQSSSYTSYTSYSSSSSSSGPDGQQTTGHRQMESSYTDPSGGTHVTRATQNLGEPVVQEERRFDAQGREMLAGTGGGSEGRRIEDVTDKDQAERDRKYEEAIEEEYAKREGGA